MTESHPVQSSRSVRVKVVGVGGAGCNAVDQMLQTDLAELPLALVHTHARVLQQHSVPNRLLIGLNRTHGLGTGGDAELARVMAENDRAQLAELVSGNELVFIIAGLGGGTGTGVSPAVAKAAKESGALVIAIVTTPFDFEGERRHKQAQFGLQMLRSVADAVICLPNQKLCRLLEGSATIVEAFASTNALLVQGIRGLWQMLTRAGLINVDFSYLCSALRGRHTESLLAMAEATGPNRAREVVDRLLNHPMLEPGSAFAEMDQVLVSLIGAQNLSVVEITTIMDRLKRQTDAELIFGTAVDPTSHERVSLTLIASKFYKGPAQPVIDTATQSVRQVTATVSGSDSALVEDETAPRPAPRFIAPPPETTPEKTRELLDKQPSRIRRGASKWKQELLALEIVSRGRFEKSEPTIHRGADLDVPTYIRRGVPLN